MSVIVQSGSKQYIVEYGQKFIVDRLKASEGDLVDVEVVYSFGDYSKVKSAKAKIVAHKRGEKVRVVKYKSKSNYHRQYGHRSEQTVLELVK
ncbi:MAG: 50S ribosomal protein L21 [Patescibacteria group bacterium]